MKLKQKKLFFVKEFIINDDSLIIRSSNLNSSDEVVIPFEEIDFNNIIKRKTTDNLMLIVTGLFSFFFIVNLLNPVNYKNGENPYGVLIVLFFFSLFSGLITFIKTKNVSLIPTSHGKFIEMFNNNPSISEQHNFLENLKTEIRNYLKNKYSKIDFDLPSEPQLMNFAWLKNMKIINDNEYEALKNKLLKRATFETGIGFNQRGNK